VLQPVEVYRDAAIFYSLGNLAFDMPELEARRSAIATLTLRRVDRRWQLTALALHAVVRAPGSDGPTIALPDQARALFARVLPESERRFGTTFVNDGSTATWRPASLPAARR
jgi:poly-gamma-glutamate capsule biosynthesis protein CapA/YwtB (metallophosphatase superfamily)